MDTALCANRLGSLPCNSFPSGGRPRGRRPLSNQFITGSTFSSHSFPTSSTHGLPGPRLPHVRVTAQASVASAPTSTANDLLAWLSSSGFPDTSKTLKLQRTDDSGAFSCVAARQLNAGDVIFNIPENFAVTAIDVASHPVLSGAMACTSSDLGLLALWLLWEQSQDGASPWAPYVATFTPQTLSPLLWSPEERESLLRGYSGLAEIDLKIAEIHSLWAVFNEKLFSTDPVTFPPAKFAKGKYLEAFTSVLSRAVFLPGADIFALIPLADFLRHSPTATSALEYNTETQSVQLKADRAYKVGEEIVIARAPELASLDLAIQSGATAADNPGDYVTLKAGLVSIDPLYLLKKQILQEEGFSDSEVFPLFRDRFPRQLLSYLRLARLQDAAQLPKITFKADMIVSETNEYEVLMLLLNECKERLQAYPQTLEDDLRQLNMPQAQPRGGGGGGFFGGGRQREEEREEERARRVQEGRERLAAQLRASEKRILNNTVTALRLRLAPIRGIPTKSGMGDPNSEIKEMFGIMEAGFSAPKRVLADFMKKQKK